MDEQFQLIEKPKLRSPQVNSSAVALLIVTNIILIQIVLFVGSSNAGKSRLAQFMSANYSAFFDGEVDKATIFYPLGTDLTNDDSYQNLPSNIQIARRRGIKPEQITPEVLRSQNDNHSICILEDQLSLLTSARGELEEALKNLFIRSMHHDKVCMLVCHVSQEPIPTHAFQITIFITLQSGSFKGPLLSVILQNCSTVVFAFYRAPVYTTTLQVSRPCDSWSSATRIQHHFLQTIQRAIFPGCPRNLLAKVVNKLRKDNHSHLLLDGTTQRFYTDIYSPFPLMLQSNEC